MKNRVCRVSGADPTKGLQGFNSGLSPPYETVDMPLGATIMTAHLLTHSENTLNSKYLPNDFNERGKMVSIRNVTLLLAVFMAFHSLCLGEDLSTAQSKGNIFTGEIRLVGNGVAWAWVECDEKGTPTRIGATFTETALSGLPADLPASQDGAWEYPLSLPVQVDVPPYTHIVINWEPHGHVPPGIYDVPHFDFHFYLIDPAQRVKITCRDSDQSRCFTKPDTKFMPAGYILPSGTDVPRMGVHWVDPSSPEFNKQPFTKTFIYGSYDGYLSFLEPMTAKTYLDTKPNSSETIKLPIAYQRHGYYPTAYTVKYDPTRKEYTVALDGLILR